MLTLASCVHNGEQDPEYRDRRNMIVSLARSYKHGMVSFVQTTSPQQAVPHHTILHVTLLPNPGDELPRVEYTDTETETWGVAYNKLKAYHELYAVNTFKEVMKAFEDEVGFSPTKIPQLQDISQFLRSRTGFSLRPVGGLLSARDFLNGLAFKVFFSTQVWAAPGLWAARGLPLCALACMRADTRCCCPARLAASRSTSATTPSRCTHPSPTSFMSS